MEGVAVDMVNVTQVDVADYDIAIQADYRETIPLFDEVLLYC